MKPSQETMIVAATECLAGMSQRDLAKQLVDTAAERMDLERKLDARCDEVIELNQKMNAAIAVLQSVVTGIGCRDIVDFCSLVRSEMLRLRERPTF